MKIYIGSDHRGFHFKEKVKAVLRSLKYSIVDVGTDSDQVSCDYPSSAYAVATKVAKDKKSRGILLCMSGIGQAIAANKVPGAYAALCYNVASAKLSRQHNNANILVMGSRFVKPRQAENIVKTWLTTEFEGGRHQRRVDQIKRIEKRKKP